MILTKIKNQRRRNKNVEKFKIKSNYNFKGFPIVGNKEIEVSF
jgi:hypothetical protein